MQCSFDLWKNSKIKTSTCILLFLVEEMSMFLKKFIILPAIFSHEMDINVFEMVRFVFVMDLRFLRHRKWSAVSLQYMSHSAVNREITEADGEAAKSLE